MGKVSRAGQMESGFFVQRQRLNTVLFLAFSSFVEVVDKPALIQLSDEAHIDKILRVGILRPGVLLRKRV